MMGVFVQPLESNFGKTKSLLHDTEHMLHARPRFRFEAIRSVFTVCQASMAKTFLVGEVFCTGRMLLNHRFFTRIRRITPDAGFLSMQKITDHDGVVGIGRSRYDRMNQFGLAVHPDMGLCNLPVFNRAFE